MTHHPAAFPGTAQHQALLDCLVLYYENDPRILAVIVFGSLGRGNWDACSDLDMDVITRDDASLTVLDELKQLCEAFMAVNERAALIIPDGADAGDIVLESLMQLSIRYHPLAQTSPNIIESMRVLSGSLAPAVIAAAGSANRAPDPPPLSQLLDRCVRDAATVNVFIQRRQIWAAIEVLYRLRGQLMAIFARTHGGGRGYQTFSSLAEKTFQARLGQTLPQYDGGALRDALLAAMDMLENDLKYLSDGQLKLNQAQRSILRKVRESVSVGQ